MTEPDKKLITEKGLWIDDPFYHNNPIYLRQKPEVKKALDDFRKNGYIVFRNGADQSLCEEALTQYETWKTVNKDRLLSYLDDNGFIPRIINLHQEMAVFRNLFLTAKALEFQDIILQGETTVYTSLFFERGTSQPIHRDTPYFWTDPTYHYLGMWVALEDADQENGALKGIAGGHMIPEEDRGGMLRELGRDFSQVAAIDKDLWDCYQKKLMSRCLQMGLRATQIDVKKGDIIVWHPQFPHGGGEIKDKTKSRKSVVYHTIPLGASVYQSDAFFNPDKMVAPANFETYQHGDRAFLKRRFNIGHREYTSRDTFAWPTQ